jgi:hypothetical protein
MFPDSVPKSGRITHAGSGSQFQAWMIGCISYADQFDNPHHTVVEFRLGHAGTITPVVFEPLPNTSVMGDWVIVHSYFID